MPCFLCKNINRGNHHDYAGIPQYFCTVHNEPRDFNDHCDKFSAEPFMDILAKILQDYDFYREKIDRLHEFATMFKMKTIADDMTVAGQVVDPPEYMLAEIEDIKQGLDHNRREVELLFASMSLWNYTPTP